MICIYVIRFKIITKIYTSYDTKTYQLQNLTELNVIWWNFYLNVIVVAVIFCIEWLQKQNVWIYFSSADASDSSCSPRCCNFGCFRRDDPFLIFGFCVVGGGGFSKSSNCLSVKMPLYQSALHEMNRNQSKM